MEVIKTLHLNNVPRVKAVLCLDNLDRNRVIYTVLVILGRSIEREIKWVHILHPQAPFSLCNNRSVEVLKWFKEAEGYVGFLGIHCEYRSTACMFFALIL